MGSPWERMEALNPPTLSPIATAIWLHCAQGLVFRITFFDFYCVVRICFQAGLLGMPGGDILIKIRFGFRVHVSV